MQIVLDVQSFQKWIKQESVEKFLENLIKKISEFEWPVDLTLLVPASGEDGQQAIKGLARYKGCRTHIHYWYLDAAFRKEKSPDGLSGEFDVIVKKIAAKSLNPDMVLVAQPTNERDFRSLSWSSIGCHVIYCKHVGQEKGGADVSQDMLASQNSLEQFDQEKKEHVAGSVDGVLEIVRKIGAGLISDSSILTGNNEHQNSKVPSLLRVMNWQKPKMAFMLSMVEAESFDADQINRMLDRLKSKYEVILVRNEKLHLPNLNQGQKQTTFEKLETSCIQFDCYLGYLDVGEVDERFLYYLLNNNGLVYFSRLASRLNGNHFSNGYVERASYEILGYQTASAKGLSANRVFADVSVIDYASAIAVNLHWTKDYLQQWCRVDSGKTVVVTNIGIVGGTEGSKDEQLAARKSLGFKENDFVVCSFVLPDTERLTEDVLRSWAQSQAGRKANGRLVFIGDFNNRELARGLKEKVSSLSLDNNVCFVEGVTEVEVRQYLNVASLVIQLGTTRQGRMPGVVHDCLAHNVAVIGAGSCDAVTEGQHQHLLLAVGQQATDSEISQLIDAQYCAVGANNADPQALPADPSRKTVEHDQTLFEAIESCRKNDSTTVSSCLKEIRSLVKDMSDEDLQKLVMGVDRSLNRSRKQKQLFYDISVVAHNDERTGIQRVVRAILLEWLINPPDGYRIEPVYATEWSDGYYYARDFTFKYLDYDTVPISDEPISFGEGDLFVSIDLHPMAVYAQQGVLERMKKAGVGVFFIVHDILPLTFPNFFPPNSDVNHLKWLKVITRQNGAICVSKSVSMELQQWVNANAPESAQDLAIDWFHLGADIESSKPSNGLSESDEAIIDRIRSNISFLMVGTIEPRKGHLQVLEAFEKIWAEGIDVLLVLVGKKGWLVDELVEKISKHPELDRRLFWLKGISDEFLLKVYESSDCLIAASYGEGFGLPLIEAGQRKKPIMARDIPVFREVAGNHAFYFRSYDPQGLASEIKSWLEQYKDDKHIRSDDMPWITWKQSAAMLYSRIEKHWGKLAQSNREKDTVSG